ncbi:MAG TPA: tetratricopeptide repeat protein [Nocardioides sp.]|nr:tetratricopeptide repeat protein [Nocardioides sp.]
MSEDRGRRTGPRKSSGQGSSPRSGSGRPGAGQRGSGDGSAKGSYRQGGKPTSERRGGPGKPTGDRRGSGGKPSGERRGGTGKPTGDRRGGAGRPDRRVASEQGPRTKDQQVYDGPPLPEEITGQELDASVRAQLRSIPEKLGQRVARHLVAAGELVDTDPETAYQHALAARARAPRIAVVREATGETAYAAGHYAEALAELRAAKRMNGATAYLPIMADCHRALGNAKRAIELAKSPSVARFPSEAKAEMTIVEAGARRDLGQMDAALRTLELAPLNSKSRESWVVRLRYAYADTLEQAGRLEDALAWFHRTNAIDGEELTDAADRAEALEKRLAE